MFGTHELVARMLRGLVEGMSQLQAQGSAHCDHKPVGAGWGAAEAGRGHCAAAPTSAQPLQKSGMPRAALT